MADRKEIVEAKTAAEARKLAPWAAVIIKVQGGCYMAFESRDAARTWWSQL